MANLYRNFLCGPGTATEGAVLGVVIAGQVVNGSGTRDGFYITLRCGAPVLLMTFLSHLTLHQQDSMRSPGVE